LKKSHKSYYCGNYFPSNLRGGLGILFVLFSGLIIYNQKSDSLKNPFLWILILCLVIVIFSKSYIEIINNEKGLFKRSMRLFFISIGKVKNINDYKCGVIKIVNQVYSMPKGAEPWKDRDTEFTIQVAKLWFINKNESEKELIFEGKKDEMNKFINEFISLHDFQLYKGHVKKGFEMN
jgi:hypothetical protein